MSYDIDRHHHEGFNGGGYPRGLRGEEIPLSARIVAVADVWDALLTTRPYKRPWPEEAAIDHLRGGAGAQFDPMLVEAFLANLESLRSIRHESDLAETEPPPDQ